MLDWLQGFFSFLPRKGYPLGFCVIFGLIVFLSNDCLPQSLINMRGEYFSALWFIFLVSLACLLGQLFTLVINAFKRYVQNREEYKQQKALEAKSLELFEELTLIEKKYLCQLYLEGQVSRFDVDTESAPVSTLIYKGYLTRFGSMNIGQDSNLYAHVGFTELSSEVFRFHGDQLHKKYATTESSSLS